jgi:hypothetical protein
MARRGRMPGQERIGRPIMKTIIVDNTHGDEAECSEFDTFDEAIAFALSTADPGTVVSVHDADCKHDGQDDDTCSCEPLELVAGAQA